MTKRKRKLPTQPADIAIRVFHAKGSREEAAAQGADLGLYDRLRERYGDAGLPPSPFFTPMDALTNASEKRY